MTASDPGHAVEARRQQLLLAALWRRQPAGVLDGWLRDAPARAARGLTAYRHNGQAVAERALAAAYPTVALAIGDEALQALARKLWAQSPPCSGDMALWGDGLPGLVATEAPLADWPWLADLARLDWAVHWAEAAADGPAAPAGLDALAAPDAAEHRLDLAPGLALLRSDWPLATLWQAHRATGDDPLAPARAALAEGLRESTLVWRSGWRVQVQAVPDAAAAFMQACLDHHPLGAALAAAGDDFDFEPWLLDALRQGWIHALRPPAASAHQG